MRNRLPLSALLDQVCVALTIEADNEFEHRPAPRLFDGLRRWGYVTYAPDIDGQVVV